MEESLKIREESCKIKEVSGKYFPGKIFWGSSAKLLLQDTGICLTNRKYTPCYQWKQKSSILSEFSFTSMTSYETANKKQGQV